MLTRTFSHAPGLGPALEAKLWAAGITDWDTLLDAPQSDWLVPPARRGLLRDTVEESRIRLRSATPADAAWFADRLPSREHWRLWTAFRDHAAYVDIETTGLGIEEDHITTIACRDAHGLRTYVHGHTLPDFRDALDDCRLLVTFNGKCFDAPCIERQLDMALDMAHLDLRYPLKKAGLRGGLKAIEKTLGLDRGELDGVDGYAAVLFWQGYRATQDTRWLETLLSYNAADVLSLERLCARTHNLLVEGTPFDLLEQVPEPVPPENPIPAHAEIVRSVLARMGK
ncbi:ribonuclease H-like domain-containing protein [Megalodesulfovibrio paquesii]